MPPDQTGHAMRVVAGLVVSSGLFLITQRLPKDAWGGFWEFPGGKVEPEETEAQALERELMEEVGIRTMTGPLAWELTHDYPSHQVWVRFYYSSILSGTPTCREVQAFHWIRRQDLLNYRFLPSNYVLLRKLINEEI